MRTPYRVSEVRKERGRAWTLTLLPEGHRGLRFSPGQFVWISLGVSPYRFGEHPFSLCAPQAPDGRLRVTIKELGDFTRTIGRTRVGQAAFVDGPHGVFSMDLTPDAPGLVFIAGGVGIAPIMAMMRALRERCDPRPLVLFDANRVWDHVLFREELERDMAPLRLEIVHVLSEPPEDWSGERGFISRDILARHLSEDSHRHEYFVCGPTPMIRIAERALSDLGIPLARIHTEIFDLA
jgi:predicted ferric reductase